MHGNTKDKYLPHTKSEIKLKFHHYCVYTTVFTSLQVK